MRKNQPDIAETYVSKLKKDYPKSQWTTLLTDPYYKENLKFGTQIEDSLYAATYDAFKQERYNEVQGNTKVSEKRFPLGANRDKFLFIGGLSKLNNGDVNGCINDMKTVVEKYPQSRISEMAGMIVNGVQAGKKLHGGKFDLGDVWSYRSNVLNDSDSIHQAKLSPERDIDFKFLLIYNPDSVNEHKLLFEMARFNFTNFLVRNFEIEIQDLGSLHQMQISGFRNYDEAYQYARQLLSSEAIITQMGKTAKGIIISDKNLKLIGTAFSYKDYEAFYAKNFAPLAVTKRYLLSEPASVTKPRERDLQKEIEEKHANDTDLYPDTQDAPTDNSMTIPLEEPNQKQSKTKDTSKDKNVIELPKEEEKPTLEDTNTFEIPMEEPKKESAPATTTKPETQPKTKLPTPSGAQRPAKQQPATTGQATKLPVQTPQTPLQKPQMNGQKPQTPPVKKPKPTDDGPIIYFGNDEPQQGKGNNKNNKKNQPIQNNIEDEYYDLDGF